MALLRVEGLTARFDGVVVLSDVSFAISEGQSVGLIGEAGAGKSILALAIAGLAPSAASLSGTIAYGDQPVLEPATGQKPVGKRVAVIFQDAAAGLDPLRTVSQHLREALPADTPDSDRQIETLVADLGLGPRRAGAYPRDLDPGERQLVAIGMALASRPELLVADDPTGPLDLVGQRRALDLIGRHCRERNMSLLLISSEIKAIAMLCSRILVLHDGRLVEAGEKSDVFGHPKHEFTRALLTAGRNRARTLMRTPIGGTLLDVRGLRKRYRRPDISFLEPRPPAIALDDVSFTMRSGESMGVVGPAGAGKTTLARIVAGLERPHKGELEYDARIYHGPDLSPVNRGDITMLFADPRQSFDPVMTMGESIAEPLRLDPDGLVDELSARMLQVITAVGLEATVLQRHPSELSLAELYRAGIARALISKPKLVVIDDPVAVLDVASRGEMLVLLNRLRADFGLTFLLASRDLDIARAIADRLIILDNGRIVETGTPAQLLEKPQHETTARLVAAALPEIGIVPVF